MNPRRQFIIFLVAVVGFVVILMLLFGRGPASRSNNTDEKKDFTLTDFADKDSNVVLLVSGPIVGDDRHRAIRYTIDSETRQAEIIQGFEGKVIDTISQPNNPSAYEEFLHALGKTGFGKERKSAFASENGICATGFRFVYEVNENDKQVSRTWGAGCVKGNSPAISSTVRNLFTAQITDHAKFSAGTWNR